MDELPRRQVQEEVVHAAVANDRQLFQVSGRASGCLRGVLDQQIERFDQRALQPGAVFRAALRVDQP
jgi:hypothetical protein